MEKLVQDKDYYLDENGLRVMTKEYHLKRGYCCDSGCKHCPYENHQKYDPTIPRELQFADE